MTTTTNKFKIRAANYSADELECILSHLEANPGLLDAKVGGQFNSAEEYKQAWEEVAEKVSEVGGYFGVKRTGHDVKKKWSDLKHRVKTKVATIAMESESGIHGTSVKLSAVDERVFALMTQLQENQPDKKYIKHIKDVKGPSIRVFSFQQESSSNAAGNSDQEDDDAESSQIESELVNEIKATSSEEKKRRISEAFNAANDRGGIQLKRAKQLTDEEQLLELCVSQKQIIGELSSVKDILKKCQVSIEKLAILKRAELQLKCAKHGVEFDDLFN